MDHKLLESTYHKHLINVPPQLARILLRIQKYDLMIKYLPGKRIALADALNRVQQCVGNTIKDIDVSVHELHLQLNTSAIRMKQIRDETAKDHTLLALWEYTNKGWPSTLSQCPPYLHEYRWLDCESHLYRHSCTSTGGSTLSNTLCPPGRGKL